MSEEERGREVGRREFLKLAGLGGAALLFGCGRQAADTAQQPRKPAMDAKNRGVVAVASKGTPAQMVQAAMKPLGGIEAFVKKGNFVVIKPNIGWQRTPEQAATTHPDVVAAVVTMCKAAGAGRVLVVEHTCDQPYQICFEMSGIQKAVEAAGGEIVAANREGQYDDVELPYGKLLKTAKVISDIRKADCFINLPKPKDHSQTLMTAGLKNLMGAVWDRQAWHNTTSLNQCIADFSTVVRPHLTIMDAIRILVSGGPKGPGDTKDTQQVFASVDPVAADAYAASLLGRDVHKIEYLGFATEMGLGECDLAKMKVVKV